MKEYTPIMSKAEAVRRNQANGLHFFDRDTLRFFDSVVGNVFFPSVIIARQCSYFVTSEQFHGSQGSAPRKYTVRAINWASGDVRTVGGFQAYATNAQATAAARRAAHAFEEPGADGVRVSESTVNAIEAIHNAEKESK